MVGAKRFSGLFRPSVMPYIRMETTLCIVEDFVAKLMSSIKVVHWKEAYGVVF